MAMNPVFDFDRFQLERLNTRQREVLLLLSKGLRNSEIGRHLFRLPRP